MPQGVDSFEEPVTIVAGVINLSGSVSQGDRDRRILTGMGSVVCGHSDKRELGNSAKVHCI